MGIDSLLLFFRIDCFVWNLAALRIWPGPFRNTPWKDEVVFHFGGFVNRHNCHYWTWEDARITSGKMQNWPKVTVWCGMTSDRIVGPFIFCNTMIAERYFPMLQDEIWSVINSWKNIEDLILMQDGAPPDLAIIVREWLNKCPLPWEMDG